LFFFINWNFIYKIRVRFVAHAAALLITQHARRSVNSSHVGLHHHCRHCSCMGSGDCVSTETCPGVKL